MNVSQVSSTSLISNHQADDAVGLAVLKKAQQIEQQTAAQLIAALPQPASPAPVGGIGQNIDVRV